MAYFSYYVIDNYWRNTIIQRGTYTHCNMSLISDLSEYSTIALIASDVTPTKEVV